MFSGRKFHAALARPKQGLGQDLQQLWDAVEEGLEEAFREERRWRGKRDRKERVDAGDHAGGRGGEARGAGMFGVLASLGVQ